LLSCWIAAVYGFIVVLPVGLLWRGPGTIRHFNDWAPTMALAAGLIAVIFVVTPMNWQLSFVAWIALPALLISGLRYGAWAMAMANLVATLAIVGSAVLAWNQIAPQPRLERQTAAILMIVVALSILLLVEQLRRTSKLNQCMFEQSPVATMRVCRSSTEHIEIVAANRSMSAILGVPSDELSGVVLSEIVVERHHEHLYETFGKAQARREDKWNMQLEVELLRPDRAIRLAIVTLSALETGTDHLQSLLAQEPLAPESAPQEFTVYVEDVTARREAERAVTRLEIYDSTTGLLNRKAFLDRLDAQLHRRRTTRAPVMIMVLEVDDLKVVNESLGHVAGDRLLLSLAVGLGDLLDAECALARIGGDEYALIAPTDLSREQIGVLAGTLIAASSQIVDRGVAVSTGVSVGVASSEDESISSPELMRRADLALYRAKQRGRSSVEFYSETIGNRAAEVLNVRRLLGQAIVDDSLAVALQPIVDLADGTTVGYEALVRLWNGSSLLAPGAFLDTAREMDLLSSMDTSVMRKVLRAVAEDRLPQAGAGVSVNTEPESLLSSGYAHGVMELLAQTGVDPARLTIEVIESALLSTNPVAVDNVETLRSVGVRMAIDDFGTGYSNMIQLRHLSADILKIDRSFVASMQTDPEAAAIVRMIIRLAQDLGMQTVAEGIETRSQATHLAELGCERAQGYWFGRPTVMPDAPSPNADRPLADPEAVPVPHSVDIAQLLED
jgi:diguanylate cyclase (GGDEF)-like protein